MERLAAITCEPFSAEFEISLDKPHIRTFFQCIIYHGLVLVYCDRAGGIDQVSPCFRLWAHAVNGAEDQLFLEMGQKSEVAVRLGKTTSKLRQTPQFARISTPCLS